MVHTKLKGPSVSSSYADYQQASGFLGGILTRFRQQQLSLEQREVAIAARDIAWGLPLPPVTSKVKRLLDIVGAVVGLGIVAILLVPIAIAIQIDHPGAIFFSQTRYGYRGRPFRIWKFRSMIPDAEAQKHTVKNEAEGLIFKNEEDPRITRIGRFLRRTSLDELPQFFNVLVGDMSLVGTRPPVIHEVTHYNRYHWQRLAVKPGITGRWQTSGRSSIKDFEQIVEMDLDYQADWSIWLDLQIIFKTVAVVFGRKDAC
ncbi:sugar transferase [cf. Phormidesmis sp. LEGE 11477]|nr:sugar transferase [cf. Phormidesmis sp. LEGE 11477]